ncbi:hypothetical protein KGQ71_03530 [Patescibacteria group bacterium]|nr:hypothetical protein [Patescibacteria group bacterium]
MTAPTHSELKKAFLDSGYEIRFFPRHRLEQLALDAPSEVKRHRHSNIMGLIMPDENIIGLANDLSIDERVMTLIHELIHLIHEQWDEEEVESLTEELEQTLTPEQFGFFQFLVA